MSASLNETTQICQEARQCVEHTTFATLTTVNENDNATDDMFRKFGQVVYVSSDAIDKETCQMDEEERQQIQLALSKIPQFSIGGRALSPTESSAHGSQSPDTLHSPPRSPSSTSTVDETLSGDEATSDELEPVTEQRASQQVSTCKEQTATTSKIITSVQAAQQDDFASKIKTTYKLHCITNPTRVGARKGAKRGKKDKKTKVLRLITDKAALATATHNRMKTFFKKVIILLFEMFAPQIHLMDSNSNWILIVKNYRGMSMLWRLATMSS